MRTLVHIPTGLSTPELEIMLAKAQGAIDANEETTIVTCAGGAGYACSLNIYGMRATCGVCKAMVKKGVAMLHGNFTQIETPAALPTPPLNASRAALMKDRWAIKAYTVDGADVGQAAYSSYIAQSRDQDLEGRLASRSLNRLLATTEQLVPWFRELLKNKQFRKIILYNGRQNQYRPLLRVAQQEGIPTNVMEYSGQDADCVYMFHDQLPQDLEVQQNAINECWANFKGNVAEVAEGCYAYIRAGGVVLEPRSYVIGQTSGMMPQGWDATKHNVAIFNSSEDEHAAIGGEYDKRLYVNQIKAMQRLCESLKSDPDVVLWLRIHPNLSNVHWSFAEKLLLLSERYDNVKVIPGNSKVSSYDLLDACNAAVSFGSTMGIEANYWGKPSILLGRCVYERLGSAYTPQTHEEAVELIRTRNLAPLPVEGALKLAVFWKRGGHAIPHFTGSRRTGFRFRDQLLQKTRAESMVYKAAKFVEKIVFDRFLNCYLGATRRIIIECRRKAQP